MRRTLVIASLMAAAAACSKKEEKSEKVDAPAEAPAAKPTEPAAAQAALPDPFKAWDMAARTAAWQGAWILEPSLGFQVAVEVSGDKARQWDGTEEKAMSFSLKSPCEASVTEHKPDGSSQGTVYHYTLRDGKLALATNAGSRKGNDAIACVSNMVYTLSGGTCLEWMSMFERWESKPGTCSMDDKSFKATANGMEVVLEVYGDALIDKPSADRPTTRHPDFEAAKAARK